MRLCLSKSRLAESHGSDRGDLACVDYARAARFAETRFTFAAGISVLFGDQSPAYLAATWLSALAVASAAAAALVGLVIW